jgi:hypothetical protein
VTADRGCNCAIARRGSLAGPLQDVPAIMMTRLALVLAVAACSKKSARIGVAECDAYQERMTECAAKLGGAVGKQLETVRETMLKAWTAERNNPGLARACSDATGDMQKQLPQCAW